MKYEAENSLYLLSDADNPSNPILAGSRIESPRERLHVDDTGVFLESMRVRTTGRGEPTRARSSARPVLTAKSAAAGRGGSSLQRRPAEREELETESLQHGTLKRRRWLWFMAQVKVSIGTCKKATVTEARHGARRRDHDPDSITARARGGSSSQHGLRAGGKGRVAPSFISPTIRAVRGYLSGSLSGQFLGLVYPGFTSAAASCLLSPFYPAWARCTRPRRTSGLQLASTA